MKILLLGADGQVGWELRRALAPVGDVVACTRADIDLANIDRMRQAVRAHAPDIVVNAAAYTAVDKAESEPAQADAINHIAVGALAEEARQLDAWLVHYSTDYVFDGLKTAPYVETDTPNPINVYGVSKLRGEEAIRAVKGRHLILRTSWVYAVRGHNFPKTILRAALARDALRVVNDQIGAPTSADLIADVTAEVLAQTLRAPQGAPAATGGTFHLTAAGHVSWHGFACHLLGLAQARGYALKATPDRVAAVTTAEYPAAAKRIANSRLATDKLQSTYGMTLPPWQTAVERFMAELPPESVQ
jgi:dTDP-4-dehydrorhamnose reductase